MSQIEFEDISLSLVVVVSLGYYRGLEKSSHLATLTWWKSQGRSLHPQQ
uniref:Uncharacterized protein n=1 Tax=Siphoviridae sp. ct2wG4 TaxID=2826278 RepID=A0A8S5QWX4_9CAUD|nr:MAG TPA: hypothetical protein [Siphoviridae sp. ct2wG4]DAI70910.1 MAG TPA: hypothetical protein [Caudoviricetes sp.]DAI93677.1 MAG TPA: hypothetical protein [Caudoviricetes sp.]DAU49684.1 MAG TPA: hypothetical protein [Caudoviricetes sp.]DAZ13114.1 MAG TPA: hypothetical protein [Caudoviricetes sp.]